jgi:predicted PhzF superfamily epimerase YddE/YHI9
MVEADGWAQGRLKNVARYVWFSATTFVKQKARGDWTMGS